MYKKIGKRASDASGIVLFQPFKQKFLLIFHLEFLQKTEVFLLECPFPVVLLLVHDVLDYLIQLGMAVRESTIAFLPMKMEWREPIFLYKTMARFFDLPDQSRKAAGRAHADQKMDMVRHAVDGEHFLSFVLDNAGNVAIQAFFPCREDEALPAPDCENHLDVNLGIGRHD